MLERLESWRSVEIPKIRDRIATAREYGDLSENAEYHAAREEMGLLQLKILELEERLADCRVVSPAAVSTDNVQIYTRVTLRDLDSGQERIYTLVSLDEMDMASGRISIQSPIGEGLAGHVPGDEVEIRIPAGIKRYQILKIDLDKGV